MAVMELNRTVSIPASKLIYQDRIVGENGAVLGIVDKVKKTAKGTEVLYHWQDLSNTTIQQKFTYPAKSDVRIARRYSLITGEEFKH